MGCTNEVKEDEVGVSPQLAMSLVVVSSASRKGQFSRGYYTLCVLNKTSGVGWNGKGGTQWKLYVDIMIFVVIRR